jgi:hypothetical protein
MPKYLGETPVDTTAHPDFKVMSPSDFAMVFIAKYGQIDGGHHKAWVLDQVSRILHGTPVIVTEASWDDGTKELRFNVGESSAAYLEWRQEMLGDIDGEGEAEYGYDEGIAP